MMRGPLSQPQAPLAPDDARQLLGEVLFGRPLRMVLRDERFEERPIFIPVFPRQHSVLRQHPMPQRIEPCDLVIAAARLAKSLEIFRHAHVWHPAFSGALMWHSR